MGRWSPRRAGGVFSGNEIGHGGGPVDRDRIGVDRRLDGRVQGAANGALQVADSAMPVTARGGVLFETRMRARSERPLARRIVEEGRMPGAEDREGQSPDPGE